MELTIFTSLILIVIIALLQVLNILYIFLQHSVKEKNHYFIFLTQLLCTYSKRNFRKKKSIPISRDLECFNL